MNFDKPIIETIQQRFSCRSYLTKPLEEDERKKLQGYMDSLRVGPLGTPLRFQLVAATEEDRNSLKGLGTYGFIRNPAGFIVGAVNPAEWDMEDYGYLMEEIILFATELGLGTCWLGGSFTKSSFSSKISATNGEQVPAISSLGYIKNPEKARNSFFRRQIGAHKRLAWESLFFEKEFSDPLTRQEAGDYGIPLEMVQIAPSASNKQPWRVVKDGNAWHFYIQRTKGYRDGFFQKLLDIADLQRVDLGIAMCHFEFSARALGFNGKWQNHVPAIETPDPLLEYRISYIPLV